MKRNNNNDSGYTDSRGEWRPEKPISFAPVFVWPPRLKQFFSWLFNYLFSWNLLYLGIVLLSYYYLQPPLEEMKTFKISWALTIFIRNMTLVWIVYGGWHVYLYKFKKRGAKSKYSPRWQSTNGSTFLWNNQVYDNVFWTCAVSVPIWTTYEVVTFWLYANGNLPYIYFHESPVYFIILFLLIPIWRELHFYLIHRLIHWKPLYKRIHYLHHYNINPGPWSGLTMHPIESLLYFSVVLIHWIVPSHPIHFLFNAQHTALTPAPSHSGFEGKVFKYLPFGSYFHYLHHRLFECNYGETSIPLDNWFGIFNDGSQTQTEKREADLAYYKLRVKKNTNESPEVKSFYFCNLDNSELRKHIPGQHLTFKIPFHKEELFTNGDSANVSSVKYALRSYTLSNHGENNQYRISVKREQNGKVSSAFHNSLKVGDILEAKAPKGSFILQKNKGFIHVFIAAGIGITPILAMLKSLGQSTEKTHLILAAKEESLLCFADEINNICREHPEIKVDLFFSRKPVQTLNEKYPSWQFHNKRVDVDSLKAILQEKKKYSFYICGPEKMNTSLSEGISKWKGKQAKVYTEKFGVEKGSQNLVHSDNNIQVHFAKSNKTVLWENDFNNLLEFAESNGVSLEAGCMFGECGACITKVEKGTFEYNYNTAAKPIKENCLPCSCCPTSNISLDA